MPVFFPAIAKSHEIEVLAYVFRYLFSTERCDCVSLTPLSGLAPVADAVRRLCSRDTTYRISRDDSRIPHTFYPLPESFDDYLIRLSKQARRNFRRYIHKLSKLYELESKVLRGMDAIDHFDKFARLHEAQWTGVGKLGHFGDWPEGMAFNRDLVNRLAKRDLVRIHELTGNGEILSMQYSFVLADRCYNRLSARRPSAELEKLNLGRIGLLKMLESLIDDGVRLVEAGPGHYDYKMGSGGEEFALLRLIVTRSSMFTRQKTLLFLLWFDLIDIIYYRIWFLKIAPKIPFFKFSLWHTWIRTRL
jgi:hypothetical protein